MHIIASHQVFTGSQLSTFRLFHGQRAPHAPCILHNDRRRLKWHTPAVRRQNPQITDPARNTPSPELSANIDADFVNAFNELCTGAVRAMLSGDPWAVEQYLDKVDEAGNLFAEEDNREACIFVYVLYGLCTHKLVKQHTELQGMYQDAFNRISGLLEDSGWQIVKEGEKDSQEHVDSDVLQPPVGSVLENYS